MKNPLFWKHPLVLLIVGSLLIWLVQQNALIHLKRQEKLLERKYEVISNVASIPAEYYQNMWNYFFAVKNISEIQTKSTLSEKDWEMIQKHEARLEKYRTELQTTIIKAKSVEAQLVLFKNKEIANSWNKFLEIYWRGFYPISREGITEENLNEQLNKAAPYTSKTLRNIFVELGCYNKNAFIENGESDMELINMTKHFAKILISVGVLIAIFLKQPIIFYIIGIIAYFIGAHMCVEYLMKKLWDYIGIKREPIKLTATLGNIDRLIYAFSFVFKQYTFIGIWLGIKIASRLVSYTNITTKEVFDDEARRKNGYLIGNVISLALGLMGGIFIKAILALQVSPIFEATWLTFKNSLSL